MPLFLEFKPKKQIASSGSEKIIDDLMKSILKIPSIVHTSATINVAEKNGFIEFFKVTINGLSVIDNESAHMLHIIVSERLDDSELPFYVSGLTKSAAALPGEAAFLHERLKPLRSKNAKLLSKINVAEIPEDFCCKLSGEIMDEPVYDMRAPGVNYDQDFLQYWLRINEKKLMPHTNIPSEEFFIKVNFGLKARINDFIKNAVEAFEIDSRRKMLEKFKITETGDKKGINQALRRAAMLGASDEIELLLSIGADVNSQDENSQKRFTPLHLAIRENKINCSIRLLRLGARIDIPDAAGIMVSQLIIERLQARDPEIQPVVLNCDLLGLSMPGVSRVRQEAQIPHSQNQAGVFARTYESAVQQQMSPVLRQVQMAMNKLD